MNPVYLLWKKRMIYLVKTYYKFIRFQIDWIIMIYVLLLVGGLVYLNIETIPKLSEIIQNNILLYALYPFLIVYIVLSGKFIAYLKPADEFFLSPLNELGKKFAKYSFLLNMGTHVLKWTVLSSIAILLYKGISDFSVKTYLPLYLWGLFIKLTFINTRFILQQQRGKWVRRGLKLLFFWTAWTLALYFTPMFLMERISLYSSLILIFCAITFWLITTYFINKIQLDWGRWIQEESDMRSDQFSILLGRPPEKKKQFRKKTFSIFSGVRLIPFTKEGALYLLYFRKLTRNTGNLMLLLQLTVIALGTVFISNNQIIFIIVLMFVMFIMSDFLVSIWSEIKDLVWFNIYPFSNKQKEKVLTLGPFIVLGTLVGIVSLINILYNGSIIHPATDIIAILLWSILCIVIQINIFLFKNKGNI
ncbi:ABC transporter permease [Serpentinicella sp. ANB-PHB4]|uniref:ABC transporter permease n=1 Tax=Serpentinicella sp. ANB-PHB4 TaxID=3074076 RepID=UPI0028600A2C|nr:ABC transporter permease [Serpentinicella sp. ANB-PHB4]MDR5659654.1 ABC transporter permease [Serpentinicella sp. ANB-PHB4]